MKNNQFILYGANGYTGKLITELARDYSLEPVLAGRNENAIKALAAEHKLPYQIADINNPAELIKLLSGFPLVLHAAGPFRHTAKQMIEACLLTNTHYIDITGEIPVFEMAKTYNEAAMAKGIMLMPGSGFDVVPTDCLALFLKNKMPDAVHLNLAFVSQGGGLSHGTATTMAESLGEGGAARENGKIVSKPLGHKSRWVEILGKRFFVMTIPWGDIATGYHTTSIPNIETYTGIKPGIHKLLKLQFLLNPILRTSFIRNFVKKKINQRSRGPSPAARKNAYSLIWGETINKNGESIIATLSCPDGYTLTSRSSLLIAQKILNGNFRPGYQTPGSAYGADLVLEIPGVERQQIN